MVGLEDFREMMDEIIETIPEKYFAGLNGGILLQPQVKYHPKGRQNDLVIMGEYHYSRHMGRSIYLYYGSFRRLHHQASPEELRSFIRETLLHELTHHLESLAGERDLEIEDEIALRNYDKER